MHLDESRLCCGPIWFWGHSIKQMWRKKISLGSVGSADMKIRGVSFNSFWILKNEQEKAETQNFYAFVPLSTDVRKGLSLRRHPVVEQISLVQDQVGANSLFNLAEQDTFFFFFFNVCLCRAFIIKPLWLPSLKLILAYDSGAINTGTCCTAPALSAAPACI